MNGHFSDEALALYQQLLQVNGVDFTEKVFDGAYDFARCVRPDGSAYGTGGKCRKGTEGEKKEESAKPPKPLKTPKSSEKEGKAKTTTETAPKGGKLGAKEAYAKLVKKQQELIEKGDMAEAMKLQAKVKAALDKAQNTPEQKEAEAKLKASAEANARSQKDFEAAQKKRDSGQLAAGLTTKDKKVISDYTKETGGQSARSYDNMNGCLRNPPSCPNAATSKKFVKEFDAALAKLPKNQEGNEFYRGVQVNPGQTEQLYKALEKAQPGMRLKDPGYGSYSAERRQADHFTNRNRPNIVFVTRNKNMTPINMFSEVKSENEAILPRGTEQTIRRVTKEGRNLIVELD